MVSIVGVWETALFMNGNETVGLSRKTEVFFIYGKRCLYTSFLHITTQPLNSFTWGLAEPPTSFGRACVVCSWPWASVSSPTEWEYYFCRGIMKIRTRCAGAGECLLTASWRELPAARKHDTDTLTLHSVLNDEGVHKKEFWMNQRLVFWTSKS